MQIPFMNDDDAESSSGDEEDVSTLIEEAVHSGTLQLSNRMLDALPGSLEACAGLCHLDLSSNSLCDLPPSIANLVCLEHLDLAHNKLSSLPLELGSLTALATLRASYNQIDSLPVEVAALPSLTCLDLSDNKLTALPSKICQSRFLTELRLDFNAIKELPRELFRVTTLLELGLEGNPLRDPPKAVVSKGTEAILDHLRSLLFGRSPSRPASCSSSRPASSSQVLRRINSGASSSSGPPQVLVVEAAGDEPSEGGPGFVGALVESPGKEHKPYDEEMEMDMIQEDDDETDWGSLVPGQRRAAGGSNSVDNILSSMHLDETDGELGGGAEAVLQRTANLLATGLQELHTGRPLTAGGEAKGASGGFRGGSSGGGGGSVRRPGSAMRRPGTASVSGSLWRPMSAALPRPGTASAVHGGSSSSSSASHPSSSSWRNGLPSTASSLSQRPSWLDRAGVTTSSGGSLVRSSLASPSPSTSASMHHGGPAHHPRASSGAAGADAGGGGALLTSMPALTFPLAASMSKLSRNKMGAKLTSSSGEEVALGRMSGNNKVPGGQRPASGSRRRHYPAESVADEIDEDDEGEDDMVRRIIGAHNPALLQAMDDST